MSKGSMLVVDDDQAVREFIAEVGASLGFHVFQAANVEQFTECYQSARPTLLVLDLLLPETDGVKILRGLGDMGPVADVLLISGSEQKVLDTAQRLGASYGVNVIGGLHKPIVLAELEALLRRSFSERRRVEEAELREAIEARSLTVHYQPKVKLAERSASGWEVDAVEALVRWPHPDLGLLTPDAFLMLAEETWLIKPLTYLVFQKVFEDVRSWTRAGLLGRVAVNLSWRCLDDLDLPDRIGELLEEKGLAPSCLVVEITESGVMEKVVRAMDVLTRFRIKGVGLSIDDVGTGYSSLLQLYRLPFSEMKIDKSFVLDVAESKEARVLVRAITDLGHNLGISVCAEGIESQAVFDLVHQFGCNTGQGYFIGEPSDLSGTESFLRQGARGLSGTARGRAWMP